MEEIRDIHEASLEWGAICNIVDKIGGVEEKIGPWDDLINLVVNIFNTEGASKDNKHIAMDVFPFFWSLYFRIRSFDKPVPFNRVSKLKNDVLVQGKQYREDKDGYMIYNYDYNTYMWAKKLGMGDYVCVDWLWVRKDILTPAQIKRLDKMVEENEKSKTA